MRAAGAPFRVKAALLGLILCLAVYGLVAFEAGRRGGAGPVRRTTYSPAPGGLKALYLWLRALDIPVDRWEKGLTDMPRDASVILIAEPEMGPDPGELNALEDWIRQGGTAVFAVRPPNSFLNHFGLQGSLMRDRKDPGGEDHPPVTGQPGLYTRGALNLSSRGHPGLISSRPGLVVHARDAWGGLLASERLGKGRLIALSDPELLSNGSLREGDHARLALNLLVSHLNRGRLLVDEYHHGYGRATSVLGYLGRSRAMEPLFQGVILSLLLWAVFGRRFGPPRPLKKETHRSSLEYVEAMGRLVQRAGARRLALGCTLRGIEDRARGLLLDRDPALKERVRRARERQGAKEITEKDLLQEVRGLYEALEGARRGRGRPG